MVEIGALKGGRGGNQRYTTGGFYKGYQLSVGLCNEYGIGGSLVQGGTEQPVLCAKIAIRIMTWLPRHFKTSNFYYT